MNEMRVPRRKVAVSATAKENVFTCEKVETLLEGLPGRTSGGAYSTSQRQRTGEELKLLIRRVGSTAIICPWARGRTAGEGTTWGGTACFWQLPKEAAASKTRRVRMSKAG